MNSDDRPGLGIGARFRIAGIWASGLLGCGLAGAGVGAVASHLSGSYSTDGGSIGGFFAGLALFTCTRLWARERR